MRFLETFKILFILSKCTVRCLLWAVYNRVLNSINVLGDKTFNSVCDLDRFLPLHSKFFSVQDCQSSGYLVYITHGVDHSSVYLSERL